MIFQIYRYSDFNDCCRKAIHGIYSVPVSLYEDFIWREILSLLQWWKFIQNELEPFAINILHLKNISWNVFLLYPVGLILQSDNDIMYCLIFSFCKKKSRLDFLLEQWGFLSTEGWQIKLFSGSDCQVRVIKNTSCFGSDNASIANQVLLFPLKTIW